MDYFDLQRLGGLLSHLRKTLKDDLASKANIVIDPLELQAATMDDLDEDEEPAPSAAQVWQEGQVEAASCGLFLHPVGRGMTQVRLLSV